jgi:hypothetical protein
VPSSVNIWPSRVLICAGFRNIVVEYAAMAPEDEDGSFHPDLISLFPRSSWPAEDQGLEEIPIRFVLYTGTQMG